MTKDRKEYNKRYYQKNKKRILKRTGAYKKAHMEDYLEQSRRYRKENPEKVREIHKDWLRRNPGKASEYSRRYSKKHPDRVKAKSRAWSLKNDRSERRQEQKRRARFKKFGLTPAAYEKIWKDQNECCAICGGNKPVNPRHTRLHIDHDHVTKAVRGILCHYCNNLLGNAKDNIAVLEKAIVYLKKENDFRDTDAHASRDRHRGFEIPPKNNTSGYIGITWLKNNRRWQVSVRVGGKEKYIGCFQYLKHAVKARRDAERNLKTGSGSC